MIKWLNLLKWLISKIPSRRGRAIFRYHDGTRWRSADPMVLQREIFDHPQYSDGKLKIADKDDEHGKKAYLAILQVIRDVFDMPPYKDGAGSTEEECWTAWARFVAFIEDVKKNTETWQTLSDATDSEPGDSQKRNDSDSSSTSTECTPAAPSP